MAYHVNFGHPSRVCGCWYELQPLNPRFLPLVKIKSHTTILSTVSRTTVTHTFINSANSDAEINYSFPLFDGVSIVSFKYQIGDKKVVGVVKEKDQARQDYHHAIDSGQTAGLLNQNQQAADVFTTEVGNVPAKMQFDIEIVYLGELKQDIGTGGIRFSIPTLIAPRYGMNPREIQDLHHNTSLEGGIDFTVDIVTDKDSHIRQIESPSHPISVRLGRISTQTNDDFELHKGSAILSQRDTALGQDFVLLLVIENADIPKALLETHPDFPNQRCLMTTLVPRFQLPRGNPEVVFVVDRSGSMEGDRIKTVSNALIVLLKSLPIGVKFNIYSFGSSFSSLWPQSQSYNQSYLDHAIRHVSSISASYGGTEMLAPISHAINNRYKDLDLELIVLTDGEIWNQQPLMNFAKKSSTEEPIRIFTLGIGSGASTSLVEGLAASGNGFAQFVGENEILERKMIRLLKGALSPHIGDYSLEVKYEAEDEDFVVVEPERDMYVNSAASTNEHKKPTTTISLYDNSVDLDANSDEPQDRYAHLPSIPAPKILQTPSRIPDLFPFNRTVVYIFLDDADKLPNSVILHGTSEHGPLHLEIDVQDIGIGETIHQLAAKRAMTDAENGGGWLANAVNSKGERLQEIYPGRWSDIIQREYVRLGVKYQVVSTWCSFVAIEETPNGLKLPIRSNKPPTINRRHDGIHDVASGPILSYNPPTHAFSLSTSTNTYDDPTFNLEFGPVDAPDVLENFDFDSFLNTSDPCPKAPDISFTPGPATSTMNDNSHNTSTNPDPVHYGKRPLPDYQMELLLLEQQNKRRLMMSKQEILSPNTKSPFRASTVANEDKAHALVKLQSFDGSWSWSTSLADILAVDFDQEPHLAAKSNTNATAMTLLFLMMLPEEKDIWELVMGKAIDWLKTTLGLAEACAELEKCRPIIDKSFLKQISSKEKK